MKKLKLKRKYKILLFFITILLAIIFITLIIKNIIYRNSDKYKLLERGYSYKEVAAFEEKLSKKRIEKLTTTKKNDVIYKIITQKYYISKNLDRYLAYQALKPETKIKDVIAIVNVNADNEWYDKNTVKETDMSKGDLILVNKFNYLKPDYIPDDLETISIQYAYNDNQVRKHVNKAYIEMWKQAKSDGVLIIASSSFRKYEWQDTLFKRYTVQKGEAYAESVSARPGYSEHQSGLTIDILTTNTTMASFDQTDAFKWLEKNAYKYGFIIRYPKGKTYLTGYSYESWHYRYVGKEVASKIYKEKITFDEYYAYYIENKQN